MPNNSKHSNSTPDRFKTISDQLVTNPHLPKIAQSLITGRKKNMPVKFHLCSAKEFKGATHEKTTFTNHVHLYIFTGAGKDRPKHTVRNKSKGSSNTHTQKQPSRISHIHQKPYKLSQGKRKRTRPKHADKLVPCLTLLRLPGRKQHTKHA